MLLLRSPWFAEALPRLVEGGELSASLMADAINDLTSGAVDEIEATSFLIALRMKGETGGEIAAAVRVLRGKMTSLATNISGVLDTCGTGGDGSGTFNISTAVSLVAAAAGCPVVKHGNRSVSSRSGSADVLAELGVPIEKGPAWAQTCLERFGFAFCFAPHFHPVLAHIGPLRRKLGVRTIFNLLGPLLNPAGAPFQLLGVGKLELLDPLAEAVALLGMKRAFLVCSEDGLDEVSLSAPTHVRQVENGAIKSFVWDHNAFGLPGVPLNDLRPMVRSRARQSYAQFCWARNRQRASLFWRMRRQPCWRQNEPIHCLQGWHWPPRRLIPALRRTFSINSVDLD